MSTQGFFQPTLHGTVRDTSYPATGPILWETTWRIVGTFEPNLKNELFPSVAEATAGGVQTQVGQQKNDSSSSNSNVETLPIASSSSTASII